jgi:hypothetical protein
MARERRARHRSWLALCVAINQADLGNVNESRETRMGLQEVLNDVLDELRLRAQQPNDFSQERLERLIMIDGPAAVRPLVGPQRGVKGSAAGSGGPPDVPWIGVFPDQAATSAQQGLYLVYLFAKNGTGVFLSFNQGTEKVTGGRGALGKRARDVRDVVDADRSLEVDVELHSENERPKRYEAASAYAVRYSAGDVPPDSVLADDVSKFDGLLTVAHQRGLKFESPIEPLHLLFKWNAEREPRTIELHREVADREERCGGGALPNLARLT